MAFLSEMDIWVRGACPRSIKYLDDAVLSINKSVKLGVDFVSVICFDLYLYVYT